MRVWLENGTHLIIEGEVNFNNAGFVDTQRAIPARWVELVPVTQADNQIQKLREALKPFANYACDPPCGCHNCIAKAALEI